MRGKCKIAVIALCMLVTLNSGGAIGETWTSYTAGNWVFSMAVSDGILWCATSGGLVRYDLESRNGEKWLMEDGLPSAALTSVAVGHDGTVWIGTSGSGLCGYKNGSWVYYTSGGTLPSDRISDIVVDEGGYVWCGTDNGIAYLNAGEWTSFTEEDGLISNTVRCLDIARDGSLWCGTENGLSHFDGEVWESWDDQNGLQNESVSDVQDAVNGYIWCTAGAGLVSMYDGESWTHYTGDGLPEESLTAVLPLSEGVCLVGSQSQGMYLLSDGEWSPITTKSGIVDNNVSSIMLYDGDIFAGTHTGISRLFDGEWVTYKLDNSLVFDRVMSVAHDWRGGFWAGTWTEGASYYDGTVWTTYNAEDGLPGEYLYDIVVDSEGSVWFADGLTGIYRLSGGEFTNFTTDDGLISDGVYDLYIDSDNTLWCATMGGFARFDGTAWTAYTNEDILSDKIVRSVIVRDNGDIWCGYSGGVCKWDGGTSWMEYNGDNGLTETSVHDLIESPDGLIWAVCDNSIASFDGTAWSTVGADDGMPLRSIRDGAVDPDGVLWFSSPYGAASYADEEWHVYTVENGLISNSIWTVQTDSAGRVYFGTLHGVSIYNPTPTSVAENGTLPSTVDIPGNFPNPFNPVTTIRYSLPDAASVTLSIYNITGQLVRTLVNTDMQAGNYSVIWDGADQHGSTVASGVYIAHLRCGSHTATHRMMLLR